MDLIAKSSILKNNRIKPFFKNRNQFNLLNIVYLYVQNDPDLQNAFKGIVRTYWLAEVDGTETDTDSVQTEPEEPHERVAGEAKNGARGTCPSSILAAGP